MLLFIFFFFQAEDGIRDLIVTGVQTCALPISVPDSSNAMALGFSEESGIKLEHALIRNHYVGRTFIHPAQAGRMAKVDRKSTRLNSSHDQISYAVFCLKKKKSTIIYHSLQLQVMHPLSNH